MEPAEALADLLEISSQVQAAVIFDDSGAPVGSTIGDDERSASLARTAAELLADAERIRSDGQKRLTQIEAVTRDGSVFVVREAGRTIVATTTRNPTSGLVLYDLKSCLRSLSAETPSDAAP